MCQVVHLWIQQSQPLPSWPMKLQNLCFTSQAVHRKSKTVFIFLVVLCIRISSSLGCFLRISSCSCPGRFCFLCGFFLEPENCCRDLGQGTGVRCQSFITQPAHLCPRLTATVLARESQSLQLQVQLSWLSLGLKALTPLTIPWHYRAPGTHVTQPSSMYWSSPFFLCRS